MDRNIAGLAVGSCEFAMMNQMENESTEITIKKGRELKGVVEPRLAEATSFAGITISIAPACSFAS